VPAPVSLWQPLDLLLPSAHAQTASAPASRSRNQLGLSARQDNYIVVYGSAATQAELEPLAKAVKRKGIVTRSIPGSKGDMLLIPADEPIKPYSEAVLSAVQAQEAGATPYLVPVP
jgi:hypothetical protein